MGRYIVVRLIRAAITLFGIVTIAFFILRLSGDPVGLMLPPNATVEEIETLRHQLGLDRPLLEQYTVYVSGIAQGDFGESLRYRQPALEIVAERLPATLELAIASFVIAVVVAIPVGIISALRPNGPLDLAGMSLALVGQSVPTFWLGIMLIVIVSVNLGWLPTSGYGTVNHLILPSITLAAYSMASIARLMRSAMLDVLGMDYIRTARAKGLREMSIVMRHAMRNAAIPVVTITGLQFGILLSGAVVTEMVFAWPGIGRLALQSIFTRDYPVVQAVVVLTAGMFVLVNIVVDLLYVKLDPRIGLS